MSDQRDVVVTPSLANTDDAAPLDQRDVVERLRKHAAMFHLNEDGSLCGWAAPYHDAAEEIVRLRTQLREAMGREAGLRGAAQDLLDQIDDKLAGLPRTAVEEATRYTVPWGAAVKLRKALSSTPPNAVEKVVKALEFYANPFNRRDDDGDPIPVPDFYSELNFGDRASDVLKAWRGK